MLRKNFIQLSKKKAVLMTVSALLIALLFLFIYGRDNFIPSYYSSQSTNTRIHTMDEFAKSVPAYAGDALEIATYSALNSVYDHYLSTGIIPNSDGFQSTLRNCMWCGYLNCHVASPVQCPGMNGTDIQTLFSNLSTLAKSDLNINVSISLPAEINSIAVSQQYPFDIDASMSFIYSIKDSSVPEQYSTWNKQGNVSRVILIRGLRDPLVGINNGREKFIRKTTICEGNESCWNIANTSSFYNEQSFRYSPNATSFLSRYWNSTEPSACCGIESLMNVSLVSGNSSYLDYYYYSGVHTCDEDTILVYNSIASNFKFDSKTAARYGISDSGVKICDPT